MSAAELMVDLIRLGIRLEAHGDRLRYHPRSAMTPDLAERLRTHKAELLVILRPKAPEVDAPNGVKNVHFSSERHDWETPQDLFDKLDSEFQFGLDVCATPQNAKCARFFTSDDDGLAKTWEGVCWMNPPYGREIPKWMKKAYESSRQGATVVCLVSARTDTQWWHEHATRGEIRCLKGRLKFGGSKSSAPFPSAIVVFRPPELGEDLANPVRWEDAINPPAPCAKCGTLELWQTLAGNWRCLWCDPPTRARRLAEKAAQLRKRSPRTAQDKREGRPMTQNTCGAAVR